MVSPGIAARKVDFGAAIASKSWIYADPGTPDPNLARANAARHRPAGPAHIQQPPQQDG
jgi:hypothetical protein